MDVPSHMLNRYTYGDSTSSSFWVEMSVKSSENVSCSPVGVTLRQHQRERLKIPTYKTSLTESNANHGCRLTRRESTHDFLGPW